MTRFTTKIAKQIAQNNFDQTLDCVLGIQDPDYSLEMEAEEFEQNFEEHLEEMGFNPTPGKISAIAKQYEALRLKAIKSLEKLYSK